MIEWLVLAGAALEGAAAAAIRDSDKRKAATACAGVLNQTQIDILARDAGPDNPSSFLRTQACSRLWEQWYNAQASNPGVARCYRSILDGYCSDDPLYKCNPQTLRCEDLLEMALLEPENGMGPNIPLGCPVMAYEARCKNDPYYLAESTGEVDEYADGQLQSIMASLVAGDCSAVSGLAALMRQQGKPNLATCIERAEERHCGAPDYKPTPGLQPGQCDWQGVYAALPPDLAAQLHEWTGIESQGFRTGPMTVTCAQLDELASRWAPIFPQAAVCLREVATRECGAQRPGGKGWLGDL
jgi:hypothetical protein